MSKKRRALELTRERRREEEEEDLRGGLSNPGGEQPGGKDLTVERASVGAGDGCGAGAGTSERTEAVAREGMGDGAGAGGVTSGGTMAAAGPDLGAGVDAAADTCAAAGAELHPGAVSGSNVGPRPGAGAGTAPDGGANTNHAAASIGRASAHGLRDVLPTPADTKQERILRLEQWRLEARRDEVELLKHSADQWNSDAAEVRAVWASQDPSGNLQPLAFDHPDMIRTNIGTRSSKEPPWHGFVQQGGDARGVAPVSKRAPAPASPGTLATVLARIHKRMSTVATPPAVRFDYDDIRRNTDALLAGHSLDFLFQQSASKHGCVTWDEVQAVFAKFPGRERLQRVVDGVKLCLDMATGFRTVPERHAFTPKYREKVSFVNANVAADAAGGKALLFDVRARHVLFALGFHTNPLSWVPKSHQPFGKGRCTVNCSKGPGAAHYLGSLNQACCNSVMDEWYGDCWVNTIRDVATDVERIAWDSEDFLVWLGVWDITGAYKHIKLDPAAGLLMGSEILDPSGAKHAAAYAVPTSAHFGFTKIPSCFSSYSQGWVWLAHNTSDDWHYEGFETILTCGPTLGEPRPRHNSQWIDDALTYAATASRCNAFMLSSMRAAEVLMSVSKPDLPTWASSDPKADPIGAWTDPKVVAPDKTLWADLQQVYAGWKICGASRTVTLAEKGWDAIVKALWILLPPEGRVASGATLEKVLGMLRHYAACQPIGIAFLGALRSLLTKHGRSALDIPLDSASMDLGFWRALVLKGLANPSIFQFKLAVIAGLGESDLRIATDASGLGGGGFLEGFAYLGWHWTSLELAIPAGHGRGQLAINCLELAALITVLRFFAETVRGRVVELSCDNAAAVGYCQRYRSRCGITRVLLQWLGFFLYSNRTTLRCIHLAGIHNDHGDLPSRLRDPSKRLRFCSVNPYGTHPLHTPSPGLRRTLFRILTGQDGALADADRLFQAE